MKMGLELLLWSGNRWTIKYVMYVVACNNPHLRAHHLILQRAPMEKGWRFKHPSLSNHCHCVKPKLSHFYFSKMTGHLCFISETRNFSDQCLKVHIKIKTDKFGWVCGSVAEHVLSMGEVLERYMQVCLWHVLFYVVICGCLKGRGHVLYISDFLAHDRHQHTLMLKLTWTHHWQ
jgi:hypothetical protein